MDIIIQDHSPANLEQHYENHFLLSTADYSIMCEATELVWIQFIPNRDMSDHDYVAQIYKEIYQVAEVLQTADFGQHFNVAKIGNVLPYYHIHLVFRNQQDEAWPSPIWCKKELKPSTEHIARLKATLENYFKQRSI